MKIQVNIMPTGRKSLPVDICRRLGLSYGGAIFIEETAEGLVEKSADPAIGPF